LIGYPFNTKGYKVLDLATKRIHVSRDVLFHETIFPFVIAHVGSSFNFVLQFLVHHYDMSDMLPCMSSKTNNFVDDEMLNSHTLVEVTSDHVPIPENTPVTEPTALIPPAEPNVSALGDAPFAPRRTTRSLHPPSYLKDYTYSLPNLHPSPPITDVSNLQHSLTSFISHPDHVCFTTLCPDSQQLINNVSHDIEPSSYK